MLCTLDSPAHPAWPWAPPGQRTPRAHLCQLLHHGPRPSRLLKAGLRRGHPAQGEHVRSRPALHPTGGPSQSPDEDTLCGQLHWAQHCGGPRGHHPGLRPRQGTEPSPTPATGLLGTQLVSVSPEMNSPGRRKSNCFQQDGKPPCLPLWAQPLSALTHPCWLPLSRQVCVMRVCRPS